MTKTTHEITLPIDGMTCASCASHVERALKQLPGVAAASVNLATERAMVEISNRKVDAFDLVTAVREAGFDVPTEDLNLPIGGMTCVSCAAHVEGALSDTDGVVSASVNLATERATVTFIPGMAGLAEMKAAVSGSGYQVLAEPDSTAGNSST